MFGSFGTLLVAKNLTSGAVYLCISSPASSCRMFLNGYFRHSCSSKNQLILLSSSSLPEGIYLFCLLPGLKKLLCPLLLSANSKHGFSNFSLVSLFTLFLFVLLSLKSDFHYKKHFCITELLNHREKNKIVFYYYYF